MMDLLIIGSGGAALRAALEARAEGLSLKVISKSYPTNSQTSMAQGGINAALGNLDADDIESHIADTLTSSKGLGKREMIAAMCQKAPDDIAWLESIGVPFSRLENRKVAQRKLGGATHKRACYSQDYTGLKILHTLYDNALKVGVEFLNEHFLVDILTVKKKNKVQAVGVELLDIASGETKIEYAKAILLATGGYSSLYHGYTTNAFGSTGDGLAAVLRAGGSVSDVEFVQFHPTALKSSSILISESARGEGGHLLNGKKERFVDELLPRDMVARAIYEEIGKGEEVFLDIRHLGSECLMELLPQEVHLCRLHERVDPIKELIPIKPVAHYSMGGIDVDESFRAESIEGCFAVGECSNAKVHGANRLGGNSLLEIVAFGREVVKHIKSYVATCNMPPMPQVYSPRVFLEKHHEAEKTPNFYLLREELGELFYKNVGIVRTQSGLEEALERLKEIKKALLDISLEDRAKEYNMALVDFLEFSNSVIVAESIIRSALARQESRGAHYRSDYPQLSEDFSFHSHCTLEDESISVSLGER